MSDVRVSDHALVDCECKVKVHTDGSGVEIYYCPMHRAAEDLLLALEKVTDELKTFGLWKDVNNDTRDDIVSAVAAARETPG